LLKDESKVVLHNKRLGELFFFIIISIIDYILFQYFMKEKLKRRKRENAETKVPGMNWSKSRYATVRRPQYNSLPLFSVNVH